MNEWDELPSTPADATDVEFLWQKAKGLLRRNKDLESELQAAKDRIREMASPYGNEMPDENGHFDDYDTPEEKLELAKDRIKALEEEHAEDQGVIACWRGRTERAEARVKALENGIRKHLEMLDPFSDSDMTQADKDLYRLIE